MNEYIEEVLELMDESVKAEASPALMNILDTDLSDRKNMKGHVTASCLLFNPGHTKCLMIFHKFLNLWLPPGGHFDGGETLKMSAMRELTEETGYPLENAVVEDIPVDLYYHWIPSNPAKNEDAHPHFDFMFVGVGDDTIPLQHQEEEVETAEWMEFSKVLEINSRMRKIFQ